MKYLENMNQSPPPSPVFLFFIRETTWVVERHNEVFSDRDIGSSSDEMCSIDEQLEEVVCMEMDLSARKEISFNCQINWLNIFRHFGSVGVLVNNKYKFHRERKLNFYLVFSRRSNDFLFILRPLSENAFGLLNFLLSLSLSIAILMKCSTIDSVAPKRLNFDRQFFTFHIGILENILSSHVDKRPSYNSLFFATKPPLCSSIEWISMKLIIKMLLIDRPNIHLVKCNFHWPNFPFLFISMENPKLNYNICHIFSLDPNTRYRLPFASFW